MIAHAAWRRPALALFAAGLAAGPARSAGAQSFAPEPTGCPAGAEEACYRQALDLAEKALGSGAANRPGLGEALGQFKGLCAWGLGDACYFAGRIVGAQSNQLTRASVPAGEQAVALFKAGCHAHRPSAAACNALGFASAYLPDVAPADSALDHLRAGCGHGSPTACVRVAARLDDWSGPAARATTRPAAMERTACEGGSPAGCIRVGERTRAIRASWRRVRGVASTADRVRADSVVRAACHRGLPTACTAAGAAFARTDSAARYFELACVGPEAQARDSSWVGDGRGCARRGHQLLRIDRDTAAALSLFATGCALLDSDACADQALYAYRFRMEDELTTMRAVTACLEESGYGCWVAGELYADPARSEPGRVEEYYTRACRLGYGPGCTALATRLDMDRIADAYKYLRRACALRDGEACAMYGELVGDALHPDGAFHYLALACEYGYAAGCWTMMSLAHEERREVEEGQYRSRACRLDPAYCRVKN